MQKNSVARYRGGRNIALKLPVDQFDATVRFYDEVLRLPRLSEFEPSVVFEFGANRLWLDRAAALSQAELWLELEVDDTRKAAQHLAQAGVVRRDEIEALPEGFDGFWIASPASIIHLVCGPRSS
jgi:hypothetical protein